MRVKVLPSDVNANLQLDTFTLNVNKTRNVNNNKKKEIGFLKKKLKNYIIDPNNKIYYYWLFIFRVWRKLWRKLLVTFFNFNFFFI